MPPKTKHTRRLGRGLSSLIDEPTSISPSWDGRDQRVVEQQDTTAQPGARTIPIAQIAPGRHQPRQRFDEAALERLAQSIRTTGVMQPIVVRPASDSSDAPAGARWELVAGERRWRAAGLAQLREIPAVIVDLSDRDAAEWSLVENLQREDLNPIERARAFDRLIREFSLTQAELARRAGLERSTIANLIRLIELEEPIQEEIASGRLSPGHGKALLALPASPDRVRLGLRARDGGWSVRRLEQHIHRLNNPAEAPTTERAGPEDSVRSAARRDLERRLREKLATKVRVHLDSTGARGSIIVEFFDLDQLDGVLRKMGVMPCVDG